MYIPKFRSPLICTMKWAERIFTFWLRNTQRSALSKDVCPPISLRNFVPLKVGIYRYAREERHEQHRSESAGGSPAHLETPDESRDAGVTSLPVTNCSPLVAGCCRNIPGNGYGLRESTALPCSKSTGTETCVCTISHLPLIERQQTVERSQRSVFCPVVRVPLSRLRLWANATSSPTVMDRSCIS